MRERERVRVSTETETESVVARSRGRSGETRAFGCTLPFRVIRYARNRCTRVHVGASMCVAPGHASRVTVIVIAVMVVVVVVVVEHKTEGS